jgi:hypothetical protein
MSNVKRAFSVFLVATVGLVCDNGGLRSAPRNSHSGATLGQGGSGGASPGGGGDASGSYEGSGAGGTIGSGGSGSCRRR